MPLARRAHRQAHQQVLEALILLAELLKLLLFLDAQSLYTLLHIQDDLDASEIDPEVLDEPADSLGAGDVAVRVEPNPSALFAAFRALWVQ